MHIAPMACIFLLRVSRRPEGRRLIKIERDRLLKRDRNHRDRTVSAEFE
jgi:hypothetical protein